MSGDRPNAHELVEAVAMWLAEELAPTLDKGNRFQALVAAQGLTIAARELEHDAEHNAADAAALATLARDTPHDDTAALRHALARALRAGRHDNDLDAVATVLREHVRRKLDVARPGYDET